MRTIAMAVLLIWVGFPLTLRADEREKALDVIDQAIKAHGGSEALEKAQTRTRTGKGVIYARGSEVPFTTEETVQLPDRCHMVLDVERNRMVLVLNGDKGWMRAGGTVEMNKETLSERREELYVWWLMNLTPLKKEEFELKPLADAKVNGQDAAVVKVARKNYPDARLYFDKKTGLLVKIARRATESGLGLNKEYVYSDHKEYDGVKLPSREVILINGGKLTDVTFSTYKLLSRIEGRTFEKP
jgi:hypothetical protein